MSKSKAISPEVLLGLFETMRRNRHFEGTASPSMVTMLSRCTRLWGEAIERLQRRPVARRIQAVDRKPGDRILLKTPLPGHETQRSPI
jgi:hypothetical protein